MDTGIVKINFEADSQLVAGSEPTPSWAEMEEDYPRAKKTWFPSVPRLDQSSRWCPSAVGKNTQQGNITDQSWWIGSTASKSMWQIESEYSAASFWKSPA